MLSILRHSWRSRRALRSDHAADLEIQEKPSASSVILKLLNETQIDGRVFQIRDLHKITNLHQSEVLRAVEQLQKESKIILHGGEFDPLSAIITPS